jgi:excisionase family DNA binding protein
MKKTAETNRSSGSPFMSLSEAAAYLGIAAQTVYAWRSKGVGPVGVKLRGRVKYRQSDLDAWIAEQAEAEADRVKRINP